MHKSDTQSNLTNKTAIVPGFYPFTKKFMKGLHRMYGQEIHIVLPFFSEQLGEQFQNIVHIML
jgi:hypothetical protein